MVLTRMVSIGLAGLLAAAPADSPDFGRRDEQLRRLFTPLHAPEGTYTAYVTDERIDAIAARLATSSSPPAFGRAWTIARVDLLEAFGSSGRYDRYQVARLYGGIRPRVARGPIMEKGRVVASVTLISPYPDASLEHLLDGTLVVLLRLTRQTREWSE